MHAPSPVKRRAAVLVALPLLALTMTGTALAGASVDLDPKRIVFEGRTRSAEITLFNSGDAPGTYRILLKDVRMRPDGSFEEVAVKDALNPARDLVRYAPRQVTIAPGESQTVRVAVRKPAGLAPGEYRSHLLFTALPETEAAPASGPQGRAAPSEGVATNLKVNLGLSIPVIAREGELAAEASLVGPRLEPGPGGRSRLAVDLRRRGTTSLFGDVEVTRENGTVLGAVRNLAVYTNLDVRHVTLDLTEPPGAGPLLVRFRESRDKGGRVLAETRLAR